MSSTRAGALCLARYSLCFASDPSLSPASKSDGVGVGVMAIFGWELSIGFNVSTFIKSVGASVGVSLSDLKACTAGGPLVGMSA